MFRGYIIGIENNANFIVKYIKKINFNKVIRYGGFIAGIILIIFASSIIDQLNSPTEDFVHVKGGTFIMGSETSKSDIKQPVHEVKVDSFYISKYEVTVRDYIKFLNSAEVKKDVKLHGNELMNLSSSYIEYDGRFYIPEIEDDLEYLSEKEKDLLKKVSKFPMLEVTFYGAVEYCNWLSERKGLGPVYDISKEKVECNWNANGYRLPTEAEWEYAAKGGQKSKGYRYSGSNNPNKVAWYKKNSDNMPHPVGTKKPNELGIYDMNGNAAEWCWDRYNENYDYEYDNPKGPKTGYGRIIKGAAAYDTKFFSNSYRENVRPDKDNRVIGFRIVRSDI